MRRPILCLLVVAVALNFPLAACAPTGPSESEIATQVAEGVIATLTASAPTLIPEATAQPAETPTRIPEPVSQAVSASEPAILELDDGFAVDIPADALYEDDTVTIEVAQEDIPSAEGTDIAVPGTVYDVELANAEVFRRPARITIPYDPSLLPKGRTESEIFAVFWSEGDWASVESEVEEANNTVTVLTLHHSLWTWAYRVRDDITGRTRHCFTALAEQPGTVEEARELRERRWRDWIESLDMLFAQVERIEEWLEPLKTGVKVMESLLTKAAAYLIPWDKMAAFFAAHGSAPAAVTLIASSGQVIGLVSAVGGTLYLLELNKEWYEGEELARAAALAQARYHEAWCMLYALEHPDATSSPYGCGERLDEYVVALGVSPCEDWDFDPEFSAIQRIVASDYYPMAVGDYWVWRVKEPDGHVKEVRNEVVETKEIEGLRVFLVRVSGWGEGYGYIYREVGEDYVAWHGLHDYGADGTLSMTYTPTPDSNRTVLEIPLQVGQERRYPLTYDLTRADGPSSRIRTEYHKVIEAMESVDVPAGHFEGCYRIRNTKTNLDHPEKPDYVDLEWFCPGVGYVKSHRLASRYGETPGRRKELTEYQVSVPGSSASPTPIPPTPTPTPSAPGGWIVFRSNRDGNYEIYKMRPDGSQVTRLTYDEANEGVRYWSGDGEWIAFSSNRGGNREMYKMRSDGSEVTRLTFDEGIDWRHPGRSPDGQWIVFRSYGHDGLIDGEIYKKRVDGSQVTRLTHSEDTDASPSWSPDGQWIAFQQFTIHTPATQMSGATGRWQIWKMRADGSEVTRLTDRQMQDASPSWSPDGQWIAFCSDHGSGNWEIYKMRADGSQITRLTDNEAEDCSPAWSP